MTIQLVLLLNGNKVIGPVALSNKTNDSLNTKIPEIGPYTIFITFGEKEDEVRVDPDDVNGEMDDEDESEIELDGTDVEDDADAEEEEEEEDDEDEEEPQASAGRMHYRI